MTIDKSEAGGAILTLERKEIELLRLALERASFIDTPPGRQNEILRFADDLLKALAAPR